MHHFISGKAQSVLEITKVYTTTPVSTDMGTFSIES